MLVSPFTFYRGAALIMAADLAATPRSGVTVQLCGDAHLSRKEARTAERRVAQAHARDSTRVFARRTNEVGGEPRIVAERPLIVPIDDLVEPGSEWEHAEVLIKKLLSSYRRTLGREHHPLEEFRYVDAARKVVGVGSAGTRCYILLLLGRDHDDPLFLQVKEAQSSVLERFLRKSAYLHHGQRVVVGQRLMQAATDIFLGWQRIKGSTGSPATTTSGSSTTGRAAPRWTTCWYPGRPSTRASAGRPSPAPTPGGATGSPSPRTWARGRLRQRDRGLLRRVRRPERAGLRRVQGGDELRSAHRANRPVAARLTARTGL
jgi:hypothetical protein